MQNLIRLLPHAWSAGLLGVWFIGLIDFVYAAATTPYALPNDLVGLPIIWVLGVGSINGTIGGITGLMFLSFFLLGEESTPDIALKNAFKKALGPLGHWRVSATFGLVVGLAWLIWHGVLYAIEVNVGPFSSVRFFLLSMLGGVGFIGLGWVVYRLWVFKFPERAGDPLLLMVLTSVAATGIVGGPVLTASPMALTLPCLGLGVILGVTILLGFSRVGLRKLLLVPLGLAPIFFGISFMSYDGTSDEHDWMSRHLSFHFGLLEIAQAPFDSDADEFSDRFGGGDCDDSNPDIHPQALEIVGSGIDENCSGQDLGSFTPKPIVSPKATKAPLSVLFVSVDTLRADYIGKTYDGHSLTPAVDELAKESRVMERAYAPSTHTFESMPATMSGTYPASWHQSGEYFGLESTIAQDLSELGYQTAAVVSMPKPNEAMAWGFQYFDGRLQDLNLEKINITGPETTEQAFEAIDQLSEKPFFLWVHYFDPHDFYMPRPNPPTWLPDRPIKTYYYAQEVRATDHEIGRLFERLKAKGLWDNLLVVFFSDHGEGLNEFGVRFHLFRPNENIIKVPWVIRVPGEGSSSVSEPVSLIQLRATLYDILGFEGDFGPPASESAPVDVFLEANFGRSTLLWVLIRGPWKLVQNRHFMSWSLFNLDDDPNELNNLIDAEPEKFDEMKRIMSGWRDEQYNSEIFKTRIKSSVTPARFLPKTLKGPLVPGH